MHLHSSFLAVVLLVLAVCDVPASDRRPLREAGSENGRFRLRIYPGRPGRGESGRCRATLFDREDRRGRRVWTANLASDVAPCHAAVRDDGRFVVTLDEFRRGGAAHAVVIYGERGRLLREFGLRELLHGEDWQHVRVRERAVEWLPGATFAFVDEPAQFVIKLKWGRQIRIDLEKARIAKDSATDREPIGQGELQETAGEIAEIPPEILALLAETTSAPSAAPVADEEATETAALTEEAVRAALEELQRLAELSGVELPRATTDRTGAGEVAPDSSRVDETTPGRAELSGVAVEAQPQFAGNSAAAGLPVPVPDPANPVDYVAWIFEQIETDGPSAVPFYRAASDGFVEWQGDQDLYEAALRGEAEALASPEVAAWLEANQEALANLRAATKLEYRGMFKVGEYHSLIGILLPRLALKRDLARAAIIEAKRLEGAGQVDAAMNNYLDTLAVGTQSSQGPTLIENLVGMAIQKQTADSLLDSFASPSGDAIDYARLAQDLEGRYGPLRPLTETFQGERAMVLDLIQQVYEWNPDTGRYRVSADGLENFGVYVDNEEDVLWGISGFMLGAIGFEKMVAQTNDHYDALTEAAMLPYPDARQALDEIEEHVGSPAFRMQNPLLSTLLPSLGRAHHLATRAASTRQATRLITSLRAYQQKYGLYPDSLEPFGDADMVIDPFTGEPFAYRRIGEDFTLYSLSGNGIDDGGVHDRRGDQNDIVYWPRPPKE